MAHAAPAVTHELTKVPGLKYVTDEPNGLTRERRGASFAYRHANGRLVRDAATLDRIRGLVIPPAWTDVWICASPNGHIQATGRDARGRKQHKYHARWTEARGEAKFSRMAAFAEALPALRQRTAADLTSRGLNRRKIMALVVQLLEKSCIRIGNDEYAKHNGSFGLATMRDHHADVKGAAIRFRFKGKSGKSHDVTIVDAALARLVKRCKGLPGHQLFQYMDAQQVRDIASKDVNAYLRDAMGADFTAKDFRTWAATVFAAQELEKACKAEKAGPTEKQVVRAVDAVAQMLGNTRAVCRRSYVHPAIIGEYKRGTLAPWFRSRPSRRSPVPRGLTMVEGAVIALLRSRNAADAARYVA